MKKFKFLTGLLCVLALLVLVGCTKKTYTVTFETNGGSAVEAVQVEEGSKLQNVSSTKDGFTLEGWGKDAQYSSLWNFETDTVNGNITLYAKWKEIVGEPTVYTITFNSNGGSNVQSIEVNEGSKASKPTDPTKVDYTFDGWYTDEALTSAWSWDTTITANVTLYAKWTENAPVQTGYKATLVYGNGSENGEISSDEVDGNHYFTAPVNPEKEYNEFSHWALEENGETAYDFSQAVTGNITLYAVYTPKYDIVTYALDFYKAAATIDPSFESGNLTIVNDLTFGKFFFEGGKARFEFTSGKEPCINSQGKIIEFTLSGEGNNNSFEIKGRGASSDGKWVKIINVETQDVIIEFTAGSSEAFEGKVDNLPAGTYQIIAGNDNSTSKSIRLDSLILTEKLPQGPVSGLEISTTNVQTDFLLGREFTYNGLTAYLVYENGRRDEINTSDLLIMTDDFTTAGTKNVYIGYNDYDTTYTVNVYEPSSIVLYDYTLSSSRVTLPRQEVFAVGSSFSTDNLTVKAKCLVTGTDDKYIEFLLSSDDYTVSTPDMSSTGKKTITVAYGELTESYDIHVVEFPENVSSLSTIGVIVDNTLTEVGSFGTSLMFPTINHALQYLDLLNLKPSSVKQIVLTAGQTYFEKVEITLPNTFIYSGEASTGTYVQVTDSSKFATIEYNALAGQLDPSESLFHSTDGSATVSIRESAVGFIAYGVRFKNYYNTHELYLGTKEIMNDTQAVACLVQADQVSFLNCEFTSYHDTLYVQSGRHYFEDCYIEGRTDYIFGYDSTSYFKNCTIKSLGAGLTEKNGGYIVATKGNPVSGKTIKYGIIFDGCTLTGDENVQPGSVSIARGWDSGMTIMVMNSEISAHFSKEAYGDATSELNDRYTKMNAEPVASLLFEYNNTGDGAITSSIDGTVTYATSEQALAYDSLVKVFTPNNGTTSYDTPWAGPAATKDAVVNFVDESGKILYTSTNASYVGSVLTQTMIDEIISQIQVPSGSQLLGLFIDDSYTTEFDHNTILSLETTVYVLFESSGNSFDVVYDERTEEVDDWTVYMASTGSSKLGNADGVSHSSDASQLVQCDKLAAETDYLLSPVFAATNSVIAKILCGTTSTSNAVNVLVEALDAEGNVVASLTALGPAGKVTGYAMLDGENELSLTSESANIVQIRISCTTSGKNICVVSCELTCAIPTVTTIYDERTEEVDDWTVYMASTGSSKLGNADGVSHSSDASQLVQCDKLAAETDYLLSPVFAATNSVIAKILCGTTSTSNAVNVLVEALDAEGNVVASLTALGPAGKVTGYAMLDGENELSLTSESANIVQIRISCTTSGKNICVVSCELTSYVGLAPITPDEEGESILDENGAIKASVSYTYGETLTATGAKGLTLVGSLRDNSNSYQFSADTEISFSVSGACTIVIVGYDSTYGVFDIYVNDVLQTLEIASDGTYTLQLTEASKVSIKTSDYSKSYIKGINVTF